MEKEQILNVSEMYETHPAADRLPEMTPQEFNSLCESIAADGLREPVIIVSEKDRRIVDGRHRLKACIKTGVPARIITLDQFLLKSRDYVAENAQFFQLKNESIYWAQDTGNRDMLINEVVKVLNVNRRHLTEFEKYLQITAGTTKATPGANQHKKTGLLKNSRPQTHAETAKKMNVSKGKARQLDYIQNHGTDQTKQQLKAGKITVGKAYATTQAEQKAKQDMLNAIAADVAPAHGLQARPAPSTETDQTPAEPPKTGNNNMTVKQSLAQARELEKFEQITKATNELEKLLKLFTNSTRREEIESYNNKKKPKRTRFYQILKRDIEMYNKINHAGIPPDKEDNPLLRRLRNTKKKLDKLEDLLSVLRSLTFGIYHPELKK